MSKKDKSQVMDVDAGVGMDVDADQLEAKKAKKREAAQRFKENRAKEKAERVEKAKSLIDSLKANNLWDRLDADQQAFINGLANPSSGNSTGGTASLFSKLFGSNPSVGDSVTLSDAFQRTLKGKAALDHSIKQWAEKGIVVSFKQDGSNILNSTYTIEQLA